MASEPSFSPLQHERMNYRPKLPPLLEESATLVSFPDTSVLEISESVKNEFPHISTNDLLEFTSTHRHEPLSPLRIGVVLSGGQAPGGHNVIAGLFDGLKLIHPDSTLVGFCNGPGGIIHHETLEITKEVLTPYRNQGGFDLIGSGRVKIETEEQFKASEETVLSLGLHGLVVIGGDDSNTNAAYLAEYFKEKQIPVNVVGVPKTIDGDLRNEFIEIPFGFDTACKVYSELIGNLLKDALSAKKYYFFVKLMGRTASHITLECALKTHPNMALIGEEILAQKMSLKAVVQQISKMIIERAEKGKDYGLILIPEGIVEFIPEIREMIHEMNASPGRSIKSLSHSASETFHSLPVSIQNQLLMERDPHGNIQVSKIESERLLMELVEKELQQKKNEGLYIGKFSPQPLFFGYEGRSALPSNFDSNYCYTLGHAAAVLLNNHASGYMACVKNLSKSVTEWTVMGAPLHQMLHEEKRAGKLKMTIKKTLVDLTSKPFKVYQENRHHWMFDDDYVSPGPIQFFGPTKFSDSGPLSL